MAFISDGRILIKLAFAQRYSLPSFNVCSLEMARACLMAADEERAPIMLQTGPDDLQQGSPRVMAAMIRALAEEAGVPIMLHLDHGDGLKMATRCLRAGYSSVMFDGEALSEDDNVRLTQEHAEVAHAAGASLEAAAGSFGGGETASHQIRLTEPDVAARLLREGHADMVACSVGSLHGQSSKLDLNRLKSVSLAARGPIVLHGGTGIPADDIAEARNLGVVKINIGFGLLRSLLRVWRDSAGEVDMHYPVYREAREAIFEIAREKIRIMGASGQAR
jgi:fructose-bisphosphate aldolase, class II